VKKFSSTYFFAGLVVILVSYTYFFEFKKAQKEDGQEANTVNLLSEVKDGDISELNIVKGKDKKSFIKKDGIWMMTSPIEDYGDRFNIENAIRNLIGDKETELKNEDGTDPDVKTFGLDNPAGWIELKSAQKTYRFYISREKSFDGRNYHIKVDGGPKIYLASNNFGDLLEKPVKELRSKDILPENIQPTVMNLEVKGKKPISFEKSGEVWVYPADKNLKLDPAAIADMANGLKFIKAREFVSETSGPQELNKFGLSTPEVKLTVSFLDKKGDSLKSKDVTLTVSKESSGKVFLMSSDKKVIYETASAGTSILKKELSDFRDRKFPFTFDEKLIKQVQVDRNKFRLSIQNDANKWEPTKEFKGKELDVLKAQELISKIRELSADRFIAGVGPRGLNPPKAQILLKDANGKLILDVIWGEKFREGSDDYYFVRTNLSNEVLAIKANRIDEIPGENLLVSEPKPEPEAPGKTL